MEVTILTNDLSQINLDYQNTFTQQPGFAPPVFAGIQYPTPESGWLQHLTTNMNRPQAIELYNHYLIWLKCLQTLQPQVIIYNRSSPNQPNDILAQMILAPVQVVPELGVDLVLYGKYSDRCDLYNRVATVFVNIRTGNQMTFGLFRTYSPYAGYAYMVTASGARKLIDAIVYNPAPIQIIIKELSEANVLYTITYNPSLITLPVNPLENITDTVNIGGQIRFECRDPNQPVSYNYGWYIFATVVVVIVLGLIVGAIIYFLIINLSYRRPESIVYSGTTDYVSLYQTNPTTQGVLKPLPYGTYSIT